MIFSNSSKKWSYRYSLSLGEWMNKEFEQRKYNKVKEVTIKNYKQLPIKKRQFNRRLNEVEEGPVSSKIVE